MTPSELAIVVPIVAAAISFFAAVVAVVVGQTLGQRFQRRADERRWDREDSLRRRTRSEEAARDAVGDLAIATDILGWTAGYERSEGQGEKRRYVPADSTEVSALCQPIRRASLEVDDDGVRAHLEKVCSLLPNAESIQRFGAPHPARIAWATQETGELIVSAYLRGVQLPDPPGDVQKRAFEIFNKAYSAMEDLWEELGDDEE